jgi:hypothetical protein
MINLDTDAERAWRGLEPPSALWMRLPSAVVTKKDSRLAAKRIQTFAKK